LTNKNNRRITALRTEQNRTEQNRTEQNRTEQNRTEQEVRKLNRKLGKFKMKFVCIGILQQPIGTLQIPSRDLQSVFQICKANEENSK
jgi:hypothetical protein